LGYSLCSGLYREGRISHVGYVVVSRISIWVVVYTGGVIVVIVIRVGVGVRVVFGFYNE